MDPLLLLRDFQAQGRLADVHFQDDDVQFGDQYSFPRSTFTRFRSQVGEFYSLDTVLLFLQHRSNPAQYIQLTSQAKVKQVVFKDRAILAKFIEGKEDAANIEQIVSELPASLAALPQATTTDRYNDRAVKRPRLAADSGALKHVHSGERQLRDRNSMLKCANRDFSKFLAIAQSAEVTKPPEAERLQPKPAAAPAAQQPAGRQEQAARPAKPSSRYERDAASEQFKGLLGEQAAAVTVDEMYGFTGRGPSTSAAAAAPAPAAAPASGRSAAPSRAAQPAAAGPSADAPIILVPPGASALLNMYNAARFLEQGVFLPAAEIICAGGAKPSSAVVRRSALRPTPVEYVITDQPPAQKSKDWRRVVAVVAQGNNWQFKGFPYKGVEIGDYVDLFTHICGFYLHYADEKIPASALVRNWNVRMLQLPRETRHNDHSVMLDLFTHLDKFLAQRNCKLMY